MALLYLDDGILCGDVRILSQALHVLQSEGPSLGLNVKLSRSELVIFDDSLPGCLAGLFPQALLVDEETGTSRVALRGNFEFPGAAIGSDGFVRRSGSRQLKKNSTRRPSTPTLRSACVCFATAQGFVYSMRTTPPHAQATELIKLDQAARAAFVEVTGIRPSDAQWA